MLARTQAGVELVVVRQRVSIWPASRQHLVRDLRLILSADVVLAFGNEDRHVQLFDESLIHGDAAEAREPVEGGERVESP
jgi:hypothetical protein